MTNTKEPFNCWPVEVNLIEGERRLVVTWNDGHVSDFPLRYLRGFCPCAGCQGHRAGPVEFVATEGEMISDIAQVGTYAMSISWDSGHNTGIYAFRYLRQLCPCPEHRPDGIAPEHR